MSLPFTNTPKLPSLSLDSLAPPPYSPFVLSDHALLINKFSSYVDPELPSFISFTILLFTVDQLLAPNAVYCSLFSILLLSFLILSQCQYKSLLIISFLNGIFVSFIGIGNCIGDILLLEQLAIDDESSGEIVTLISQLFTSQINGAFNQIILHSILITISTLLIFIGIMIRLDAEFVHNIPMFNGGIGFDRDSAEEERKLNDMV